MGAILRASSSGERGPVNSGSVASGQETSHRTEPLTDRLGVAAAPVGRIDRDGVGREVQCLHHLVEKYRNMSIVIHAPRLLFLSRDT